MNKKCKIIEDTDKLANFLGRDITFRTLPLELFIKLYVKRLSHNGKENFLKRRNSKYFLAKD